VRNAGPSQSVIKARRGGYVLVLFALAAVIVFGFAALVIDLGFARLTQAQMNSAVDSAALEGLRFRDSLTDEERRQAASLMAALVFDDDLDPTNGDALSFGAGPLVNFSDGIALPDTDFRAAETMSIPDVPVYDPDLQLNSGNDPAGDMVAGSYDPTRSHGEQSNYSRADFNPTAGTDAFLVRMRRTNETFDDSLGISSNAPPIPFLFGRGSVAGLDAKANGIPVRSTSIAATTPAMSVGSAIRNGAVEVPGALPFVLRRSQWNAFGDGTSTLASVTAGGAIKLSGVTAIYGEGLVVTASGESTARAFGDPLIVDVPGDSANFVTQMLAFAAHPSGGSVTGYVPIVGDLSSAVSDRIIGFAYVDSLSDAGGGQFNLTKRAGRIVASNASAAITTSVNPLVVSGLFAEHVLVDGKAATPALMR
jgi:hypothetical protein